MDKLKTSAVCGCCDPKSMTTEELTAILRKDCDSGDTGLSSEEILSVMEELALRQCKSSEEDAKEAWQRFLKYWVPGVRDMSGDSSDRQD